MLETIFNSLICRTVGFLVLYAWVMWLVGRIKWYVLSWKLEGPTSLPIIGDMPPNSVQVHSCELLDRLANKYKSPLRLWIGLDLAIMITDPEDFEELVHNKHLIRKSIGNDLLLAIMDEGVTVGRGIQWSIIHTSVETGFTEQLLKCYQSFSNQYARIMAQNLMKETNNGSVDINIHMLRYAADVICDTLFDEKFSFHAGNHDDILVIPSSILESISDKKGSFYNPFFESDPKKLRNKYARQLQLHKSFFHLALDKKINNFILTRKCENEYLIDDPESNQSNKKIQGRCLFEELMVRLSSGMLNRRQIIDCFDNVYMMGADIVAVQLSMFIVMMGFFKNIQAVLYEEIFKLYQGDMDADVKQDDFEKLPYLDMCIKEVMRLYPSQVISYRMTLHDLPMENRDIVLPQRTTIMLNYYSLHRNPRIWENPDEFIPERFSKDEVEKRHKYAFLPQGAGVRNCIGQTFGVDMLKTAIIHLMRKIEFGTDSNYAILKTKNDVRVRSAQGYKVFIKSRL